MTSQIQTQVQNTLQFVTQVLSEDVLPYFDLANHQYSTADLSAILSQFLTVQNSLLTLNDNVQKYVPEPLTIFEIVVSGSALSSIDIPNLDINADGYVYDLEMLIVNDLATSAYVYAFYNGDMTVANYKSQYLQGNGSTATASLASTPQICYVQANSHSACFADIFNVPNKESRALCRLAYGTQTAIYSMSKNTPLDNINRITLASSSGSVFGIGSVIRLKRRAL